MKKLCILLALSALFLFSSCSGNAPEKLPGPVGNDESEKSDEYIRNSEKAAEIMKKITESGNEFPIGSDMFNSQNAFVIGNRLYIFLLDRGLFEVNPTTGKFEPICRDPLCQHKSEEGCPMTEFYRAVVTDGENVFALHMDYISKIDPVEGKLIPMCRWKHSPNAMCGVIACDGGYVYFAACASDTTNEIYRMPVEGGEPEQLSHLNEHIVNFTVSNGYILWTNSVWTLKCAPVDFSEVTVLAEKMTTMTSGNGLFFCNCVDEDPRVSRIYEVDVSAQKMKVVAENVGYTRAFLCDGKLYYHKDNFQETKQLFCYHADTGETTSTTLGPDIIRFKTGKFSFDSDTVIFHDDVDDLRVYGVCGDYLLVFMYDAPIDPEYAYELSRYFFLKKDGTEMAEIFFEDFRGNA